MAKLVIGTDKTVGVPAVVTEVEKPVPYALLSRVKDDTDKDIGCVIGYHTDSNNVKYAIVCLNKEFRTTSTFKYIDGTSDIRIPGTTICDNFTYFEEPATATYNCNCALALAPDYTSPAIAEARSHSFVIGGVTYYGQVPTSYELCMFMLNHTKIETDDPSATGAAYNKNSAYLSSTPASTTHMYGLNRYGIVSNQLIGSGSQRILPILEIPIV